MGRRVHGDTRTRTSSILSASSLEEVIGYHVERLKHLARPSSPVSEGQRSTRAGQSDGEEAIYECRSYRRGPKGVSRQRYRSREDCEQHKRRSARIAHQRKKT